MFSYEINIICNKCAGACFTSSVLSTPDIEEAKTEARNEGWRCDGEFAMCPACFKAGLQARTAKSP